MKVSMKTFVVILLLICTIPGSAQLFDEAPIGQHSFSHVDLPKLRKALLSQLLKDNLIQNRKSPVFFFLKEDGGMKLNQTKLSGEHVARYAKVLAEYDLGTGPNRVVLINPDCTAVGDFWDESFSGKSRGRLNLPETRKAMEALE